MSSLSKIFSRVTKAVLLTLIVFQASSCVPLLVVGALGTGYIARDQGFGVIEPIAEKEAREQREAATYEDAPAYDYSEELIH